MNKNAMKKITLKRIEESLFSDTLGGAIYDYDHKSSQEMNIILWDGQRYAITLKSLQPTMARDMKTGKRMKRKDWYKKYKQLPELDE